MAENAKYLKAEDVPATEAPGEIQEMLGRTPGWMVRWGISLFMLLLLLLLLGSWVFRYPDMVRASVVITTETPPLALVARSSGVLHSIEVTDTQKICRNQVAAIIDNPASFRDVDYLSRLLRENGGKGIISGQWTADSLERELRLGEIQSHYALFERARDQYFHFLELDYFGKKIKSLEAEIRKYDLYYNRLYQQRNLLEGSLKLARKQFSRDSSLWAGGVIPPAEYEKAQNRMLNSEHEFEQSRVNLSEASIRISELEQQVMDLALQQQQEQNRLSDQLLESYRNLVAAIAEWEQKYVLRATMDGIISFTRYWSEGQYVAEGQPVMRIVPEHPGAVIGRLFLSSRRSGKVRPGQDVLIRLENFPYLEYGMLLGQVRNISLIPEEEGYVVEVGFPAGLLTNYGKALEFKQEMTGQAEILTDRRPLLLRLLEPFRYIWEKNRTVAG